MAATALELINGFRVFARYQNLLFLILMIAMQLAIIAPLKLKNLDRAAFYTFLLYTLSFTLIVSTPLFEEGTLLFNLYILV
jgi:hypothetical protein